MLYTKAILDFHDVHFVLICADMVAVVMMVVVVVVAFDHLAASDFVFHF